MGCGLLLRAWPVLIHQGDRHGAQKSVAHRREAHDSSGKPAPRLSPFFPGFGGVEGPTGRLVCLVCQEGCQQRSPLVPSVWAVQPIFPLLLTTRTLAGLERFLGGPSWDCSSVGGRARHCRRDSRWQSRVLPHQGAIKWPGPRTVASHCFSGPSAHVCQPRDRHQTVAHRR